MEKATRARKAETPKQPSLCLRLRAPYLYPDHSGSLTELENLTGDVKGKGTSGIRGGSLAGTVAVLVSKMADEAAERGRVELANSLSMKANELCRVARVGIEVRRAQP